MRRSKAGGIAATLGARGAFATLGTAMRSVNVLAASKVPDKARARGSGIFWLDRNENPVNRSEIMNSRLLSGVTGAGGLGSR